MQVRKDTQPTTYHVACTLETPWPVTTLRTRKPLRLFRHVHDGLAVRVGAGRRYSRLMTKNALNSPEGCSTQ